MAVIGYTSGMILIKKESLLMALSLDLKRVALASYKHSFKVADTFIQESLAKKNKIDASQERPHVKRLLTRLDDMLSQKDTAKLAEDALLYSTLLQNAALK